MEENVKRKIECRKDGGSKEIANKKEEVWDRKMEKLRKLEEEKERNINRK